MFPFRGRFEDRRDAGRRLADRLSPWREDDPIVLGLPRGGVVVAYQVARALDAPLDVLLVRKIGAPAQPELALGAVVDAGKPVTVWNEELLAMMRAPEGFRERAVEEEWEEIERRRTVYREDRPALDVRNRTMIVVDDGIATGATIRAALKGLKQVGAASILVAVPVAPRLTIDELAREVDSVVCLETPDPFQAVGQVYRRFDQTTDEEVVDLLREAASHL